MIRYLLLFVLALALVGCGEVDEPIEDERDERDERDEPARRAADLVTAAGTLSGGGFTLEVELGRPIATRVTATDTVELVPLTQ